MHKGLSIGYYEENEVITDENEAINKHIALIGGSGGGKSVEGQRLMCEAINNNGTVLALSQHGTLAEDQFHEYYKHMIDGFRRDAYASEDGITCPLFTPITYPDGKKEHMADTASAVAASISNSLKLGHSQMQTLNHAAEMVIENREYERDGIRALQTALGRLGTRESCKLEFYLKPLFSRNILRHGEFIVENKINIIHLDRLDLHTQSMMMEILLSYIWRLGNADYFKSRPIYLFLDEIQDLSGSSRGPLANLISEGRKMGINLILATQMVLQGTTNAVQQRISQCGLMLYCKPAANRMNITAKMINPNNEALWVRKLRGLRRGEFVACGNFVVGGRPINDPLVITANTEIIKDFAGEEKYQCSAITN